MAELGDPADGQAVPRRLPHDRGLGSGRELEDGLQPGRQAGEPDAGRPLGQGGDELVAAAAVAQPHRPHLAVVGARGDEFGQGQLVQRARHPVGVPLGRGDLRDEVGRRHHPGEPQAGGQRLAHRAEVDDPLRVEALERADGLTVVAELPVVVVLQDQAAGGAGPVDDRRAPVRVQRDPGRVLMSRRQQHGADAVHPGQVLDPRAALVDVERRDAQPGVGQQIAVDVQAVRLDRHRPHPPRLQRPGHQQQTMAEPGADHDPLRFGVHPAGPGQIARQRGAQLQPAQGVTDPEGLVRCRQQGAAGRRKPLRAGELREVGRARQQAVGRAAAGRSGGRGGPDALARLHPRRPPGYLSPAGR